MIFNRADFYDAELHRHHVHLVSAARIGPRDRMLDIGCGAGQSTRDAARIARDGSALGIDISDALLQVARRRSTEVGLHNVAFELGDAQTKAFPAAYFDVCISRFGVMFFADPVAAFANIGHAMRLKRGIKYDALDAATRSLQACRTPHGGVVIWPTQ